MRKCFLKVMAVVLIFCGFSGCNKNNPSANQPGERSEYTYEIVENGVRITEHLYPAEDVSVIFVPEELDGYPVTELGHDAFYQHKNIKTFILPKSLQKIDGASFYRCYQVERIKIPAGVREITSNPFFRASSLQEILVEEENEWYTSIDGVLFNKDATQMISYPEGKNDEKYTIPQTVTVLGNDLFGYRPQKLKEITISSNVTKFPDYNMFLFPEDITLWVETGSVAEQYAKEFNLNYKIYQAEDRGQKTAEEKTGDGSVS